MSLVKALIITACGVALALIINQRYPGAKQRADQAYIMSMARQFAEAPDRNILAKLASLVADDRLGTKAVGALAGLAHRIGTNDIEKIVMPALIEGLKAKNTSTRRE